MRWLGTLITWHLINDINDVRYTMILRGYYWLLKYDSDIVAYVLKSLPFGDMY